MGVGAREAMAPRVRAWCLHATPAAGTWEVADVFIWCEVSYSSEGDGTVPVKKTPQAGPPAAEPGGWSHK